MKKLMKLICIVSCLTICLCGCSISKEATYDKELLSACLKEKVVFSTDSESSLEDLKDIPMNEDLAVAEDVEKNAIKSWKSVSSDCGEFEDFGGECKFSTANGEISVTALMNCDKRDALVTATFKEDEANDNIITLTSVSYEQVYSLNEKLQQAAMNTMLGMGTVFGVLIFICLLISCFAFIPRIIEANERRKANKERNASIETIEGVKEDVVTSAMADLNNDSEIIAVIAAAIAASENTTTDSFVVRSIRRR